MRILAIATLTAMLIAESAPALAECAKATIALTPEQASTIQRAGGAQTSIRLTRQQFDTIKKRCPSLTSFAMKVSAAMGSPASRSAAGVAAPFVPGGSVISAAISGVQGGMASGTLKPGTAGSR